MRNVDVGYSSITAKLTSGTCAWSNYDIHFVLKSVTNKIALFLDVTQLNLVHRHQPFGGICCCLF
jgi:hypothetical protein